MHKLTSLGKGNKSYTSNFIYNLTFENKYELINIWAISEVNLGMGQWVLLGLTSQYCIWRLEYQELEHLSYFDCILNLKIYVIPLPYVLMHKINEIDFQNA